jgi:hypothetical protein
MSDSFSASNASDSEKLAAAINEDPANPIELTEDSAEPKPSALIALTNYGDPAANKKFNLGEEPTAEGLAEALAPTLDIDVAAASNFLQSCMTSTPRVTYGLGAKISPHGAVPGSGFKKVDCSGFVRETIWRSTAPHFAFPDGSVVQHDWIRDKGYELSSRADALLQDGKIRIAFLRPQDAPSHIGHVTLVHNAKTLESHGGVGPDTRDWTNTGWQAKAFVYILKSWPIVGTAPAKVWRWPGIEIQVIRRIWPRQHAALPQHTAVSLRLTGSCFFLNFAAMPLLEAQPRVILGYSPERQSLSAMCGGKAAPRDFSAVLLTTWALKIANRKPDPSVEFGISNL